LSILYFLIPISLALLGVAVAAFFWAVRTRQFDDMDTAGWKILFDDDRKPPDDAPPS